MIFLRYETFRGYLRMYPVTALIVAINIVMFIITMLNGGSEDGYTLYRFGAFLQTEDDPFGLDEPWRYVTAIFLHAGFMHLFYNLISLIIFAPPLERLLGHVRYGLFFIVTGVVGNLFSALFHHGEVLSVGASGAIYGVYGAFLFLSVFGKHRLDEGSRKTVYSILIFGLIYSFLVPTINIWAHVGGGIAGFVLYGWFERKQLRR
ncbi:Rhomboid family protein [Paenibacillus curdlanolyticus YK9]|uniref:Rhomboid family protein n=1 Tax=Paenibacillus curdlanolyticus YK9 TaxID=717606 RepID=E0I2Z8_9BACL|nr:rhomboid family intramembrane serine protease [Paenibacillus curdlanolyticus]EFM12662.1 Rhomboid family protein [Paenibacillus curdlanolyticus YK9]